MSKWSSGRLTDVLVPTDERAGNQAEMDLVLSVTEKRGIIPQTEVYRKRVATEDVSKYKILRPLDVAYNPYLLWTNAVGQWLGAAPGLTSPVYECFRVREGQEPRYWGLVLESGLLTPYFDATAVGSVQRRRRTTVPTFLAATVEIPPLEVQRRIVDLIGAIDAHIGNLTTEARALDDLLTAVAMSAFDGREGALASYEDVCELIVGGAWGDPPGAAETDVLALGPNAYSHGRLEVAAELGTPRSLTPSRAAKRLLREGDVLLERSGGSPDQPVGRVVFAGVGSAGCVPSDFQRLLRPSPGQVLPRYFFWRLWADWRSGVSLAYSRRTTGITNLDVPAYLRRVVAWGSFEHQVATAGALDSIFASRRILEEEVATLRRVRAQIAQSLLARGVEISESYGYQPAGAA